MPNFKYTALDQNGVEKTGIITADSKIAAAEMIRAQGLLLRECEEAAKGAKPGPAMGDILKTLLAEVQDETIPNEPSALRQAAAAFQATL